MAEVRERWRRALEDRNFRAHALATLMVLVPVSMGFASLVGFIEARPGVELVDPFLGHLPRADLTWPIFVLVYASIGTALVSAARLSPRRVVLMFQVWILTTVFRSVAMFATPLDDPEGAIVLVDPITTFFFQATSAPTKDLFFSGHTSTIFILCLTALRPWLRVAFGLGTIAMGLLVLIQRVHYTIDVLAAPFFVYAAFVLVRRLPGSMAEELSAVSCQPSA
ncbi:MAG: hypothetical protein HYV07_21105 [Deltaproteobacteria bacterium]|nr:hypothetical protein [Deltaproteobacteria bacterium]